MMRYCGRDFSPKELDNIRSLIKANPQFHRAKLSREVCQMLQWFKPDGKLKEMSCRVAMLRMHKDGLIKLPEPLGVKHPARKIESTPATNPKKLIDCPVNQLPPLQLQMVNKNNSALWNEYIQRYHYLGFTPLPGAQLRYFITANNQILALMLSLTLSGPSFILCDIFCLKKNGRRYKSIMDKRRPKVAL